MTNNEKYVVYGVLGFIGFVLTIFVLRFLFTPQLITFGDIEISISPIMALLGSAGILGVVYLVNRFDIK